MRCDYLDGADYLSNRGATITRLVSWWSVMKEEEEENKQ